MTPSLLILLIILLHLTYARAETRLLSVIFVTNGTVATSQMVNAALHQLRFVQRHWLLNFGRTFRLDADPVRIVLADHDSDWYVNTKSSPIWGNTQLPRWYRLENMREEVVNKLDLRDDVRIFVYPTTKYNGQIGAYIATTIGQGGYMDFDDLTCVYGAGPAEPYDEFYPAVRCSSCPSVTVVLCSSGLYLTCYLYY